MPELSLGSTPTMAVAQDLSGIDEVRPGNSVFFDVTQVQLGACQLEDVAFSVLTSVISTSRERAEAVVDAFRNNDFAVAELEVNGNLQDGVPEGLRIVVRGTEL